MSQFEGSGKTSSGVLTAEQILALESTLAWLFSTPEEMAQVMRAAGVTPPPREADTSARDVWRNVLERTAQGGTAPVRRLLEAALRQYPDQVALKAFLTLLDYVDEYGVEAVHRAAAQGATRAPAYSPPRSADTMAPPPAQPVPDTPTSTPPSPAPTSTPVADPPRSKPVAHPRTAGPRMGSASLSVRLLKVFYVFSHADEAMVPQMEEVLQKLLKAGYLESWAHRRLSDPARWRQKLSHSLEEADIVVFLVSASFLESGYLSDIEATWALDMHRRGQARVVPVRIEPLDWSGTPLERLKPVPPGTEVPDWSTSTPWQALQERLEQVAEDLRYR